MAVAIVEVKGGVGEVGHAGVFSVPLSLRCGVLSVMGIHI